MKNKSLFGQISLIIIVSVACVLLTATVAFFAGSMDADLFDFKNLNFSNMIPVLLIGGFISCAVIGIFVLFTVRTALIKAKDYLKKDTNKKTED